MAMNEDRFDVTNSDIRPEKTSRYVLHPLHEAALRIADFGLSRPKERTKDLIGLLLCHGARAWRHSQPETSIHLHVSSHGGRFPVILRLK